MRFLRGGGFQHSILFAAVLLATAGCQAEVDTGQMRVEATRAIPEQVALGEQEPTEVGNAGMEQIQSGAEALGLTNHRLDGNRIVYGYTDLRQTAPVDVRLEGNPVWVVGVPAGQGVVWAATLEDGRTQAFRVTDGVAIPIAAEPDTLPAGMPPIATWADDTVRFVTPSGQYSPLTHAVPVGEALAFIDMEGNLVFEKGEETAVLEVNALPDARILVDEQRRLLLLTDPTSRYAHGVLGDSLEAGSITLVETQPDPSITTVIRIPAPRVAEGIAPIWVDLDGDGVREIVVTLSDASGGAQVVVYSEQGDAVAQGPSIGQGNRWRHQLAVAPFGPQGELELAAVLTPHIGGVVEFYRLADGRMDIVAPHPGFTSHVIGTRNLDMAVASVPAEPAQAVILLPTQDRTQVGAVRHTSSEAETVWTVDAGGKIVTNVAASALEGGRLGLAVGRSDGVLRVWQPD